MDEDKCQRCGATEESYGCRLRMVHVQWFDTRTLCDTCRGHFVQLEKTIAYVRDEFFSYRIGPNDEDRSKPHTMEV